MRYLFLSLICCVATVYAVQFAHERRVSTVVSHYIKEASGICASRIHKDVIYTHNDSGDTHRIYAVNINTGYRLEVVWLDGAHSQDWEDIACGPGPGGNGHYIYVADTGGNAGGDANTIYRIREPTDLGPDQAHVHVDSTLMFSWDQHDCETVMVDPNGEVYVVSKVSAGHHGKFVHLPSSAWGAHHHIPVNSGVYLPVTSGAHDPVGGDISPLGTEVLIKMYGSVYYWSIPDRNYYAHMHEQPQRLYYHAERQGEAICWDKDGNGFYTLSEGANQPLYYYKRLSSNPGIGK